MDVENIWSRVQELPKLIGKITAKDQAALSELAYLWLTLTGKTLRWDCRDCRHRAYSEVTSFTLEKITYMADKQFKLNGSQLLVFNQDHYTNANLTDDMAREILTANPGALSAFSEYPKDAEGNLDLKKAEKKAK